MTTDTYDAENAAVDEILAKVGAFRSPSALRPKAIIRRAVTKLATRRRKPRLFVVVPPIDRLMETLIVGSQLISLMQYPGCVALSVKTAIRRLPWHLRALAKLQLWLLISVGILPDWFTMKNSADASDIHVHLGSLTHAQWHDSPGDRIQCERMNITNKQYGIEWEPPSRENGWQFTYKQV